MVLSGTFLMIMFLHLMVAMLIMFVSIFMGLMWVFMSLWVTAVRDVSVAFFTTSDVSFVFKQPMKLLAQTIIVHSTQQ